MKNRRMIYATQLDGRTKARTLDQDEAVLEGEKGWKARYQESYWESESAKAWRLSNRQRPDDGMRQEVIRTLAFVGLVVGAIMALPPAVEATRPGEILGLARICVSESGWDSPHDCEGILAVLRSRSERTGMTLNQAMRAYSKRVFDRSRTDSRRWIADLHLSAQKPDGWPDHLPWDGGYKYSWMMMLEFAEDLLGSSNLRCAANHWGDRYGDKERALRAGWIEVDCGETRNMFWSVPQSKSKRR